MVASGALVAVGFVGSLSFGFTACMLAVSCVSDRLRSDSIQKSAGAGGLRTRVLVSGFAPLHRFSGRVLCLRSADAFFRRIQDRLSLDGVRSEREGMCSSLALAVSVAVVGGCLAGSPLAGASFAACLCFGLSVWASRGLERHREAVRDALPEAVRAMGACFHAGFSLSQTFMQLHGELKGPVADLFGKAGYAMEAGASAQEALEIIRDSQSVPELSFIAVAMEVQHKSGGSMKHVLDAACESLEGELELRRSLRVHTAQARLSAQVVTGVTVALVGILSMTSEGFLSPFFSSAAGVAALVCALAMQLAGVLIVRRMLEVEV